MLQISEQESFITNWICDVEWESTWIYPASFTWFVIIGFSIEFPITYNDKWLFINVSLTSVKQKVWSLFVYSRWSPYLVRVKKSGHLSSRGGCWLVLTALVLMTLTAGALEEQRRDKPETGMVLRVEATDVFPSWSFLTVFTCFAFGSSQCHCW